MIRLTQLSLPSSSFYIFIVILPPARLLCRYTCRQIHIIFVSSHIWTKMDLFYYVQDIFSRQYRRCLGCKYPSTFQFWFVCNKFAINPFLFGSQNATGSSSIFALLHLSFDFDSIGISMAACECFKLTGGRPMILFAAMTKSIKISRACASVSLLSRFK